MPPPGIRRRSSQHQSARNRADGRAGHHDRRLAYRQQATVSERDDARAANATTHALLHGRVLIQYRPGLPKPQVLKLDELVNEDPDRVVGFANRTGMTSPVAATAYLNLLTCPGVTARTLHALRVFRDRRKAFGNAF